MDRFETCLARVLRHEGGFVNHPKDPGGATNKGVTQATYDAWRNGRGGSVRDITDDEVAAIYRDQYWRVAGEGLPVGLDYAVFDFAVNSGPSRAVRELQRVLAVEADGIIGAHTRAAAEQTPAMWAVDVLCDRRMAFLKSLRHWPTFGRGWSSRVANVRAIAAGEARGAYVNDATTEPTPKADPADRKTTADMVDAAAKAKAWAGPLGVVGTFLVSVSDMPEPIQWAIAGACVILAAAGAVLLVREAVR